VDLSTVGVERAFTDNYLGTLQSDVVYAREDYIARAIAQSFFINPAGSFCPPNADQKVPCPGTDSGSPAPCQRNSMDSSGTNGNYNIVRGALSTALFIANTSACALTLSPHPNPCAPRSGAASSPAARRT